jgi:hypothetical protein
METPNDKIKMAATAALVLAALAMAWYFLLQPQAPPSLRLGNEINMQTFATVLSGARSVYLVMDVRNANGTIKQNVIRCGVDFAGSTGLGDKNLTVYSLDAGEICIGQNGTFSSSVCLGEMEKGLSILVQPGNSTSFYSNAMVVGIGGNYTEGECSVNLKQN